MRTRKRTDYRSVASLSWEEREMMIREYLSGGISKADVWRKYTGHDDDHGKLLVWMRKLGYIAPVSPVIQSTGMQSTILKKEEPLDAKALLKENERLKRQLKDAALMAEAYELMIEYAEKELKKPIKKKPGTK